MNKPPKYASRNPNKTHREALAAPRRPGVRVTAKQFGVDPDSSELFASWKQWCDDRGIKTGSLQALQGALVDRGFTQKRMTQGRGFSGLSLKGQAPNYDAL
jgi:methionine salvage enolase-phosphatase E1